jgi:hypothetical protein
MQPTHLYEVRPRRDHRGVDLISDVLPFGRLWYGEPNAVSNAVGYAKFRSRSHDAVIRCYDEADITKAKSDPQQAAQFEFVLTPAPPRRYSDKVNFRGGTRFVAGGQISKSSCGCATC